MKLAQRELKKYNLSQAAVLSERERAATAAAAQQLASADEWQRRAREWERRARRAEARALAVEAASGAAASELWTRGGGARSVDAASWLTGSVVKLAAVAALHPPSSIASHQ